MTGPLQDLELAAATGDSWTIWLDHIGRISSCVPCTSRNGRSRRPAASSQPADCVASVTTPTTDSAIGDGATAAPIATAPPNEWPMVTNRAAPFRSASMPAAARSPMHMPSSLGTR